MSGADLVRELWAAISDRRWDAVTSLCGPGLTYSLPQSGEVHDRAGYLRMNKEYPGDWRASLDLVIDGGEWVVTEVTIEFPDRTDRGISLFRCRDGVIVELREYWPEPFPIPEWRLAWREEEKG
jgi:ketosteroid isomerase-like protein